jgi:hypothetical protein
MDEDPPLYARPMVHRDPGPETKDRPVTAVRDLLNTWDPIGVIDLVQDEYDCLIAPILDQLDDGADGPQIAVFLRDELEHHFGLDSQHHTAGIEAVAQGAVRLRQAPGGS